MKILKFTPHEAKIIKHRLEVPDALADALEADFGNDDVADAAIWLRVRLDMRNAIDFDALTKVERAVLVDSLEGSTYFCGLDDAVILGELTPQAAGAVERAASGIESKFRAIGIRVSIPRA